MARSVAASLLLFCLAPAAWAGLASPKAGDFGREARETVRLRVEGPAPTATPAAEFGMTPETEVFLDGRPCAYRSVPAGARVLRVEVGPDRKTLLRIEFRSPK